MKDKLRKALSRCEPTYKELKPWRVVCRQIGKKSCEPTYKELKLF